MIFRVDRETLVPVLVKVGGIVEKRQTLPILGNILISVRDDFIQVTGTDLEIEIRAQSNLTVEHSGEITLPARKLIDICKALPEGAEISLKVQDERAFLVAGKSRFVLSTLPANDFPVMEKSPKTQSIDIEKRMLRRLLEKTAFAMGHQDVRYYLNGLLLDLKPDKLLAVAIDGHRLAKVEEEVSLGISEEIRIILPRKTVLELGRLLGGDVDGSVRVDISDRMFQATMEDVLLTSKLIDGHYPDYDQVIPPVSERIAYVNRNMLKQALVRTAILSNEKYQGVRFSLSQGELKLQAQNPEKEEAEEELEVVYSQQPVVVGFNVRYLLDVLDVLEESEVEVGFGDSDGSVTLRGKGRENEIFVVMPMKL